MKIEVDPVRVLVKALCLFVLINFLYVLIDPQVSRASAYTSIFPGRTRLPFAIRVLPGAGQQSEYVRFVGASYHHFRQNSLLLQVLALSLQSW